MLKHQLIHPKINEVLGRAGHHSTILIADGHYPGWNKRGPHSEIVYLNLTPGVVEVSQVLTVLLSAIPVDRFQVMGVPSDDPYACQGEPPVWSTFREILAECGQEQPLDQLLKWDFYRQVESPDHILTIQTGDQHLWANLLLTVGCRTV